MLNSIKNLFPGSNGKPTQFITILNELSKHEKISEETESLLWKAYVFGENAHEGQKRRSGEPYFNHCASVGGILASWNLDVNTIIAGLLHDTVEDTDVTFDQISEEFNPEISDLI